MSAVLSDIIFLQMDPDPPLGLVLGVNSITCITLILAQPKQFFFSLSHCIIIAFSEVNLFLFKCAVLYETE